MSKKKQQHDELDEIGRCASVLDVAAYILAQRGQMTAMKLQKLAYYAQAWSLVWDDRPLFRERIEAWANGPVVPRLYKKHRGQFQITSVDGKGDALDATAKETIDAVLRAYGNRSSQWLSDLTHAEAPWVDARKGIPTGARSGKPITDASLVEYYGALNRKTATALG